MIKKTLKYILCLLPWFITTILPLNYKYYNEIIKPSFAPPSLFYGIAWSIIYILVAYTIYSIIKEYKFEEIPKSYKKILLTNYIFNQSFTLLLFGINNTFLGFASCLGTLITTLFLFLETENLLGNKKYYLIPYILLSIFACILSLSIYLLNL